MTVDLPNLTGFPAADLLTMAPELRSSYASLVNWAMDAGFLTVLEGFELDRQAAEDPAEAMAEVQQMNQLIDTCRSVLTSYDMEAADHLGKLYHEAMENARLIPLDGRWARRDNSLDLATIRRRVIRAVVNAMIN